MKDSKNSEYGTRFSPNGTGASSANTANAGHIDSIMGREEPRQTQGRGYKARFARPVQRMRARGR